MAELSHLNKQNIGPEAFISNLSYSILLIFDPEVNVSAKSQH